MTDSETPGNGAAAAGDPLDITVLLNRAGTGDRSALDAIYTVLYPELKRIARARLRQQGRGHDIGTTTLVHEGFVRLVKARGWQVQDRRHFFGYAAKAMRNIIIDSAREHRSQRRGGASEHVSLAEVELPGMPPDVGDEVLQLHEALRTLESVDPELAQLVEMRYFGGYSESEIAEFLDISLRTLHRQWVKARAWMFVALRRD